MKPARMSMLSGSGYVSPPFVLVDGVANKARAILAGQVVESIVVDTNDVFTRTPIITVTTGRRADVRAIVTRGKVTSLVIDNPVFHCPHHMDATLKVVIKVMLCRVLLVVVKLECRTFSEPVVDERWVKAENAVTLIKGQKHFGVNMAWLHNLKVVYLSMSKVSNLSISKHKI